MDLSGARTLVVGGTGVLGGALCRALAAEGARLVVTGRSAERLAALEAEDRIELDLLDVAAARSAVSSAASTLGGLDLVVVASGVAGFGPAAELDDAVAEELVAVNLLGPMAVVSAAVSQLTGGAVVVLSAILADAPMAGMAAYSASKAGLAAYLSAVRREVRRAGVAVVDVRPPHLDTGLADRALGGEPPRLPPGHDVDDLVSTVLDAIRQDAREVFWSASDKRLTIR